MIRLIARKPLAPLVNFSVSRYGHLYIGNWLSRSTAVAFSAFSQLDQYRHEVSEG